MDSMIIFDLETTALTDFSVAPLEKQPRIIEFSGMKVDQKTLKILERKTFRVNPGIPIPAKVTEITGLKDEDVKHELKFAGVYPILVRFFLGTEIMIAHNLPYDRSVLMYELTRIDKLTAFPWPPQHICTVERSQDIKNHFLSLAELYLYYYGTDPKQVHRAESDVDILYAVVQKMRKEKRL